MLSFRFGERIDMRDGASPFDAVSDQRLGELTNRILRAHNYVSAQTTTGLSLTLLGRFDYSSEDAFLDSRINGVTVTGPSGLLLDVRGLPSFSFNDVEDLSEAQLERRLFKLPSSQGFKVIGSAFDDVLIGRAGNDVLDGRLGNDLLRGGRGNDTLLGREGNDRLEGGVGRDRLIGGDGVDTFVVENRSDVTIEAGIDPSIDTVFANLNWTLSANVENLVLTGRVSIYGTGNAGDNRLSGNGSANVLRGLGGNDVLIGAGNDSLEGGRGDDSYFVHSRNDIVVERAAAGSDTVNVNFGYELGAHLENLNLLGRGNIAGTGNDLDNVLRGNAGNNVLDGSKGDDILHSGPGTDVLRGGEGADLFIIHGRGGLVDHIADFVSGSDHLRLDLDVPIGNSAADFTLSSQGGGSYLVYDSSIAMLFSNTGGLGGELVPVVSFEPGTLLLATDIANWFPIA